jgi:hypothetical protein
MLQVTFIKHENSILDADGFSIEDFEYLLKHDLFPVWSENQNYYRKNPNRINTDLNTLTQKIQNNQNMSKSKAEINAVFELAENFCIFFKDQNPNKKFSLNLKSNYNNLKLLINTGQHIKDIKIRVYDPEEVSPEVPLILENINSKIYLSIDKEKILELSKSEVNNFSFDMLKELKSVENNFQDFMTSFTKDFLKLNNFDTGAIVKKHKDFALSKRTYNFYNKINKYKIYLNLDLKIEIDNIDDKILSLFKIKNCQQHRLTSVVAI